MSISVLMPLVTAMNVLEEFPALICHGVWYPMSPLWWSGLSSTAASWCWQVPVRRRRDASCRVRPTTRRGFVPSHVGNGRMVSLSVLLGVRQNTVPQQLLTPTGPSIAAVPVLVPIPVLVPYGEWRAENRHKYSVHTVRKPKSTPKVPT